MIATLSQAEIDERAAILRRFREALIRQRERFRSYLTLLEEQEQSDGLDTRAEQLEIHLQMEQEIVREITTFEQVIEPLELMYRERGGHLTPRELPSDTAETADFSRLRSALDRTRDEIRTRSIQTRDLLKRQLTALRTEIDGLRVMQHGRRSFDPAQPTTVDISA